jgi:hypothetical protein
MAGYGVKLIFYVPLYDVLPALMGGTLNLVDVRLVLSRVLRCAMSVTFSVSGFGGLVVSMLASGTRVRGFKPGRSRWIFQDFKIPQRAFLRRGSERICPLSQLWGM